MVSKIVGVGHYLPEKVITNSYFEERNPLFQYDQNEERTGEPIITSDEWIMRRMGVAERREAGKDEYVHHLGAEAAKRALCMAGMQPDDLDGIMLTSVTQKTRFPSAAIEVQKLIGARNVKEAFDIGAACAGFPLALYHADLAVQASRGNYLVVAVDTLRKITDDTDANAPLFGDGAGAAILSYTDKREGILANSSGSNPFDGKSGWILQGESGKLRMPEGKSVMREAIESMVSLSKDIKNQLGWDNKDIDLIIPHQANIRILKQVGERLGLEGKVFINIEKYGNMSPATCAVGMSEAVEQGKIKEGSKAIIVSFGAGLIYTGVGLVY